ncbi:hypothetical protein D3C80_1917570 [compost metagenome]
MVGVDLVQHAALLVQNERRAVAAVVADVVVREQDVAGVEGCGWYAELVADVLFRLELVHEYRDGVFHWGLSG